MSSLNGNEWENEDTQLGGDYVRNTTAVFTYFPLLGVLRVFGDDGELAPELMFEEPHLSLLYPPNKNIYKEHRDKKQLVISFKNFQDLFLSLPPSHSSKFLSSDVLQWQS